MTFKASTNVFDKGLDTIRLNAQLVTLCCTAPDTYLQAYYSSDSNKMLARGATQHIVDGMGLCADGGSSNKGRRISVPQSSDIAVVSANTGTHVAVLNKTSGKLLYITELQTNRSVTTSDKVTIPAWTITIQPPTSS